MLRGPNSTYPFFFFFFSANLTNFCGTEKQYLLVFGTLRIFFYIFAFFVNIIWAVYFSHLVFFQILETFFIWWNTTLLFSSSSFFPSSIFWPFSQYDFLFSSSWRYIFRIYLVFFSSLFFFKVVDFSPNFLIFFLSHPFLPSWSSYDKSFSPLRRQSTIFKIIPAVMPNFWVKFTACRGNTEQFHTVVSSVSRRKRDGVCT